MKKKLLLLSLTAVTTFSYAQVGVQTFTPKETLDVNGTIRIEGLPKDGESNALYNGGDTKQTQFKATSFVVADDTGNLGILSNDYWRLGDTDVTNRFTNIPPYSPSQVVGDDLIYLEDSEIDLEIPTHATENNVVIHWAADFIRTDKNGKILTQSPGISTCAFKITMKIFNESGAKVKEEVLAQEFFYQDAVPGVFAKNIPISYATKDLSAGKYKFKLHVGKSLSEKNFKNNDKFYLMNIHIVGEGKVYIK